MSPTKSSPTSETQLSSSCSLPTPSCRGEEASTPVSSSAEDKNHKEFDETNRLPCHIQLANGSDLLRGLTQFRDTKRKERQAFETAIDGLAHIEGLAQTISEQYLRDVVVAEHKKVRDVMEMMEQDKGHELTHAEAMLQAARVSRNDLLGDSMKSIFPGIIDSAPQQRESVAAPCGTPPPQPEVSVTASQQSSTLTSAVGPAIAAKKQLRQDLDQASITAGKIYALMGTNVKKVDWNALREQLLLMGTKLEQARDATCQELQTLERFDGCDIIFDKDGRVQNHGRIVAEILAASNSDSVVLDEPKLDVAAEERQAAPPADTSANEAPSPQHTAKSERAGGSTDIDTKITSPPPQLSEAAQSKSPTRDGLPPKPKVKGDLAAPVESNNSVAVPPMVDMSRKHKIRQKKVANPLMTKSTAATRPPTARPSSTPKMKSAAPDAQKQPPSTTRYTTNGQKDAKNLQRAIEKLKQDSAKPKVARQTQIVDDLLVVDERSAAQRKRNEQAQRRLREEKVAREKEALTERERLMARDKERWAARKREREDDGKDNAPKKRVKAGK